MKDFMNRRSRLLVGFLAGTVFGGGGMWFLVHSGNHPESPTSFHPETTSVTPRASSEVALSSFSNAGSDQFSDLVERGHTFKEGRNLIASLETVNEGNWEEFWQELRQNKARTGRNFDRYRELILLRMGEVGGAEAARYFFENGVEPLGVVFEGWAAAGPDEAMQWIEDHQDELGEKSYHVVEAAFAGLTNHHPDRAKFYMNHLEDREFLALSHRFTENLVQAEGVSGAMTWLADLRKTDKDLFLQDQAIQQVASRIADTLTEGGDIEQALGFYQSFGFRDEEPNPAVTARIISGVFERGDDGLRSVIEILIEQAPEYEAGGVAQALLDEVTQDKIPKLRQALLGADQSELVKQIDILSEVSLAQP